MTYYEILLLLLLLLLLLCDHLFKQRVWSHGVPPISKPTLASLSPAGVTRKLEPCTLLLAIAPIAYWALNAKSTNLWLPSPTPHPEFFAPKTIPVAPWSYRENLEMITPPVLRSAAFKTVAVPRTMSLLGDRSFAVAVPHAWNKLPPPLRCVHSVAAFKCQLETFLYNHAFN